MKFVVSNNGCFYGPFDSADEAAAWAKVCKSPWSIQSVARPMTDEELNDVKVHYEVLGSEAKFTSRGRRTHASQQPHHPHEDS